MNNGNLREELKQIIEWQDLRPATYGLFIQEKKLDDLEKILNREKQKSYEEGLRHGNAGYLEVKEGSYSDGFEAGAKAMASKVKGIESPAHPGVAFEDAYGNVRKVTLGETASQHIDRSLQELLSGNQEEHGR